MTPKWFHWQEYWHGTGADPAYKPRWWERRAYYEGLHDAARIVEHHRWMQETQKIPTPRAPGFARMLEAIQAIHARAIRSLPSR